MKFILGSGLIGRIARDLHPNHKFIPFGKSRFYNFNPPLAENYIISHEKVSPYLKKFRPYDIALSTKEFKRPFSLGGNLLYTSNFTSTPYLNKVYNQIGEVQKILISNTVLKVYSDITPLDVYNELCSTQDVVLKEDLLKYGKLNNININDHTISTTTGTYEYESIISTIPLDSLFKLSNIDRSLESRPAWIYLIQTRALDFEGANEVLVVEDYIDFFDVVKINENTYIFKSLNEIKDPNKYFSAFINGDFVVRNSTYIQSYIPLGKPEKSGLDDILLVGSLANWDDFCDVSTSINMLSKLNT